MEVNPDLIKRMEKIAWFKNCGEPVEVTYPAFETAKSWKEMVKNCKTITSENSFLEATNRLTIYLSKYHRENYRQWNPTTEMAKGHLNKSVFPDIKIFTERHDIDIKIFHRAQWQLLAMVMEDAYSHFDPPIFFLNLLPFYEAGHFPGGWVGEWPDGNLMVY